MPRLPNAFHTYWSEDWTTYASWIVSDWDGLVVPSLYEYLLNSFISSQRTSSCLGSPLHGPHCRTIILVAITHRCSPTFCSIISFFRHLWLWRVRLLCHVHFSNNTRIRSSVSHKQPSMVSSLVLCIHHINAFVLTGCLLHLHQRSSSAWSRWGVQKKREKGSRNLFKEKFDSLRIELGTCCMVWLFTSMTRAMKLSIKIKNMCRV